MATEPMETMLIHHGRRPFRHFAIQTITITNGFMRTYGDRFWGTSCPPYAPLYRSLRRCERLVRYFAANRARGWQAYQWRYRSCFLEELSEEKKVNLNNAQPVTFPRRSHVTHPRSAPYREFCMWPMWPKLHTLHASLRVFYFSTNPTAYMNPSTDKVLNDLWHSLPQNMRDKIGTRIFPTCVEINDLYVSNHVFFFHVFTCLWYLTRFYSTSLFPLCFASNTEHVLCKPTFYSWRDLALEPYWCSYVFFSFCLFYCLKIF